jgi:predicted Zn-dependent protease
VRTRALLLTAALGATLAIVSGVAARSSTPGRPVVVIPIGHVGNSSVRAFAGAVRSQLGLSVRIGRRVPVAESVRDPQRKQLVGERVVLYLRRSLPVARDGRTVVIGLTNHDIYPEVAGWRWSFAERNGLTGVVSVARMDPFILGFEPNRSLFFRRLRKYAVRYGALLALRRPMVIEPRSALYGGISSVDDLDFVEQTTTPRPYPPARLAWLARATRACRQASEVWLEAGQKLKTAGRQQARPLLKRWAAADDRLASALRPGASSLPRPVSVELFRALGTRAAYLESVSRSRPTGFNLRHVQSLGGMLHAAFLEAGSRACGSATD